MIGVFSLIVLLILSLVISTIAVLAVYNRNISTNGLCDRCKYLEKKTLHNKMNRHFVYECRYENAASAEEAAKKWNMRRHL